MGNEVLESGIASSGASTTSSSAATPTGTSDSSSTGANRTTGPIKRGSWWPRLHAKANKAADNVFYRLGYWVAGHPKRTLLISLVLVVLCCFGFVNFEESDGDIWVPRTSLSKDQEEIVSDAFDDSGTFAVILMENPAEGGSVLTKQALDALWELDAKVLAVETEGKTYADLCTTDTDGVTCAQPSRGVTRFWGNSFDTYESSVSSDADVLAAVNVDRYPDGSAVVLKAVFGNSLTYDDSGDVSGATALTQTYALQSEDDEDGEENTETYEDILDWQLEFQDLLEEESDADDVFNILYLTGRSIDDALNESVSGEIPLFFTTFIIMIAFVMIALGRCCSGPVKRRSWLGLGGVMVVSAAGLAAYGFSSGLGVPFTTLSTILPFILIGIGVDDMFVIVGAFDHTDPDLPVQERVALGLKRCGVSVSYTSMTNFFAFLLGSATSLPAVEYFCIYAGIAILFDFFLQITAFVALLTMDANRQKAGRMDWCCCFKSNKFLEEESVRRGVVLSSEGNGGTNAAAQQETSGHKPEVHQLTGIGRFMKEKYTPFILSKTGKALALLGTAAILAAGIYGVTQATEGFDVLDLAPDDHYARDYTELAREYEVEISTQYVPLGIYTLDVDYPDVAVQAQMQATDALMEEQQFSEGPVDSWLTSFATWAANTTEYSANVGTSGGYPVYEDRDTFYTALTAFTDDADNVRFVSNIVYDDDGEIEISRSELFLVDLVDTTNNVDALHDTRDVADQSTLDPQPFGFSTVFLFTEQYLVLYDELIMNFVLALVAVAVLSVFVLGKIAIVALICFTVVIIDVDLLGFVYHWGLDVNSITVIELIMAVGLVVDYMVHIVHYFLHQDSNIAKDLRIADALGEIGPSVMVGAATTFIGIMPLAFASNAVFRVFFRMFLIIISFGFYHGVVFIPVALSLMPDWLVSANHRPGHATAVHARSKTDGLAIPVSVA